MRIFLIDYSFPIYTISLAAYFINPETASGPISSINEVTIVLFDLYIRNVREEHLKIYARFDTFVERRSENVAKEENCSYVRHNRAIDFHSLNPLRILQIYWTGDKFREHVCGRIERKRDREKKTRREN